MSEIEVPARPLSLNSRLAPSSSRERIWRPAERVARAACLGSPAGVSGVVGTDLGAILPSRLLFVSYTNKYVNRSGPQLGRLPWEGQAPLQPRKKPCQPAENPYKPRIRGSRPGAERTVSAITPSRRF